MSVDVLTARRQQVRDFLSLVLVEMLQKEDEARKKEIAGRMRSYQLAKAVAVGHIMAPCYITPSVLAVSYMAERFVNMTIGSNEGMSTSQPIV